MVRLPVRLCRGIFLGVVVGVDETDEDVLLELSRKLCGVEKLCL